MANRRRFLRDKPLVPRETCWLVDTVARLVGIGNLCRYKSLVAESAFRVRLEVVIPLRGLGPPPYEAIRIGSISIVEVGQLGLSRLTRLGTVVMSGARPRRAQDCGIAPAGRTVQPWVDAGAIRSP